MINFKRGYMMNIKRKLPLILSGALLTVVLASTSTFASTGTVTAQTVRVRQYASTESEILTEVIKILDFCIENFNKIKNIIKKSI